MKIYFFLDIEIAGRWRFYIIQGQDKQVSTIINIDGCITDCGRVLFFLSLYDLFSFSFPLYFSSEPVN